MTSSSEERVYNFDYNNLEITATLGAPISLNKMSKPSDPVLLTCRYCNQSFDPKKQTIKLYGYCRPCCVDNHADDLKAQLIRVEKIQREIYGEKYKYYKDMGWL